MFLSARRRLLIGFGSALLSIVAVSPFATSAAFDFHNVIKSEGQCGLNNSGHDDKLVNTDAAKPYKVTLNIEWNDGRDKGAYQQSLVNQAGATLDLGCSVEAKAPATTYIRTILSEAKP
ncbi:MAG: hypothetical protein JO053_16295 [Acidobacteria bacterium]|nr:hypothetical protein [Acidobacteriota bacterium]